MYFNAKKIGACVGKLLENRVMTIGCLAEEMNCSHDHMNKAERGVRSYSIDLLIELFQFFDVSLDYLTFGKNSNSSGIRDDVLTIISELKEVVRRL